MLNRKHSRPVTFVLPGDGRSGGVRVTAIMANLLLDRGHAVRIACKRPRRSWKDVLFMLGKLWGTKNNSGFLEVFRGRVEPYENLDELNYKEEEIVIAVGTYTIPDIRRMTKPVTKIRFNHGFPARPTAEQEDAWKGPMTTITVSNTLIPKLEQLTGGNVWGVVPNGVDTTQYYAESNVPRDGIGALFSRHSNKAPELMISLLRKAHAKWPDVPQYVFGTEPCPKGLEHVQYTQLPSVDEARKIYNRSKAWIVSSRTEGLPGVVLEAIACGSLVVSTDNDGSLEVLRDGHNGLIAPRDDEEALLAQIQRSITDEPERNRLVENATITLEKFTWSHAADRMEEFLKSLDAPRANQPIGTSI